MTPSKVGKAEVITLVPTSATATGNYSEWLESVKVNAADLGKLACFLITGVAFIEPLVTIAMYNPPVPVLPVIEGEPVVPAENVEPPIPQAIITKRRENAYCRYDAALVSNKKKVEEHYQILWSTLSPESKDKVRDLAGDQFMEAQLSYNTLQLFLWIRQSHLTDAFGAGIGNVDYTRTCLNDAIAELSQDGKSLALFAQDYRNARQACISAGCALVPASQDAIMFTKRLDPIYKELLNDMKNRATRGDLNAYPATIEEAVRIAASWQFKSQDSEPLERAYKTEVSPKLRDRSVTFKKKNGHVGEKRATIQYDKNSPDKQERLMAWRQSAEGKAMIKTYKCHNCGKVGHLSADCRAPRKAVALATFEESEYNDDFLADDAIEYENSVFDDDDTAQWTFAIQSVVLDENDDDVMPPLCEDSDSDSETERIQFNARHRRERAVWNKEISVKVAKRKLDEEEMLQNTRVFFTAETVSSNIHLDSQSSVNIFKDSKLLTNIRNADHSVLIGGINKAAPKIKITKQGDFDGMAVLLHPNASCNILSQSRLKADGARISYLESQNSFLLHPANSTTIYKFSAVVSQGSIGKFYVCSNNACKNTKNIR